MLNVRFNPTHSDLLELRLPTYLKSWHVIALPLNATSRDAMTNFKDSNIPL